jgi:hypothetical protein
MRARRLTGLGLASALCLVLAACGSTAPSVARTPTVSVTAIPTASRSAAAELRDWPEFGLNPQRSNVSELAAAITPANLTHLRRVNVSLPGTVDSSPIYLHGVTVNGAVHDVIVVTTTYGRTIAIDADSGQILWTFTPPGYSGWAGTAQLTVASPLADPDRLFVYAASPNGLIHKLSLSDGREDMTGAWPARVTLEPVHEKLGAALNIDGPDLVVATSGYIGDIPPYQGHVVLIERADGTVSKVFNTLCADRRTLQVPSTCSASDSAILSRGGAVVEPGGSRMLIDTGNAPWNGTTNFGDSVLELTFPALALRQSFTPTNQEELNTHDLDLGSSAPVLLGQNRVMVAGKDGVMRVLALQRLDGHPPSPARSRPLGGEVQRLALPGGGELFSAPAVWQRGGHTTMFLADEHATAAYVLRGGHLYLAWQNDTPGTSPVMVGGLLFVYEPERGGIYVYHPSSPHPIAKLPGEPGHWNSPIVVDGHVIEPAGNANAHQLTGTLEIFSVAP